MVEPVEHLRTLTSPVSDSADISADVADPCLRDDELVTFASGRLQGEARERAHRHVDGCERCQYLLAEAAHALDAMTVSEDAPRNWNAVFQPNTMVGNRFRIMRLIGRGGMGEVYRALDTELQEYVALKTVTATACENPHAVRSLKAEVQLARRISHRNVCRIHDFCTHIVESTGEAIQFLVMEFVVGESLGRRLRNDGKVALEQSISLATELLLGLRAAHQAGVLHRDFKSDNVMLHTEPNGKIRPVILDFGLAKTLNETGHAISTRAQDQGMVGTLGYMAPEQIENNSLGPATDLYAFGVVWFEMLTGKLPFAGDTPAALAVARLHCAPLRPSQLNPDVPKWVDDIVLGCLERDRSRRFNSAQQVLDAIVSGPSPTGTAPKRRISGRSWAALSAACVVAASLGWHAVGLKQTVSYRRFAVAKTSADPSGAGAQLQPPNTTASVGDVQVYPVPAIPRLQPSVAIVGARAPTLSTRKGARSPKQPMLLLEPHEPTTPAPTDSAVSRPARNSPDWLEP